MLFFILILFFIITLFYLLIYNIKCEYFQNKIKYISTTPVQSNNTYCLLLTTYNIPDRQHIYKNILEKWLKYTSFTIFVVDSSGNKINIEHPRLHQFSFKQDTKYYKHKGGPTQAEKNSIIKAIHFFNKKLLYYDIVFKITGKYFIPQLENLIQYIPNDVDIIFQYSNYNILKIQNSELVGIRTKKILNLMKLIENNMLFENMLYNRIQDNRFKIYKLPKLEIENNIKRNDGSVLTYL